MPNCGSVVPKLCALNISRISDQFELNCEPNITPTTSDTTTAARRAVLELNDLPTSMTSSLMRNVEPSDESGRARIASQADT